jgi:hypothetical protein
VSDFPSLKAAWFALGLGALALVAWIALRPGPAPADDDGAAIRAALERIERTQAQQAGKLERLERRVAPSGLPIARDARPANVVAGARGGNGAPPDPARAAALQQEKVRALDDRLVSEPLSATWAAEQERRVAAFLAPANLKQEGLPAPSARETRCQSRLCRIRLGYADEAAALAAQAVLVQAIAPGLPHARSFVLARADGGADLLVYAGGDAQAVR